MGQISRQESPITRSSSMSYALRWKNEHVRMVSIIAGISCAFTVLFFILLNGTTVKTVSLIVNGEKKVVTTTQWLTRNLLEENGIKVNPYDRVSTSLDSAIKGRDTIYIDFAFPIKLTTGGEINTFYTTAKTVGGLIREENISLGVFDKVIPSPHTSLKEGDSLQIIRVEKKFEEIVETKFYEIEKKDNPRLIKGKEKMIQKGVNGTVKQLREMIYEDGVIVSTVILSEEIQVEPIPELVSVGSANPVTILTASAPTVDEFVKDGVAFEAKRVLNNVMLTAYSAHFASTGKSEGMDGYGVTYTGTTVLEGRTIAVDPKVIPLGWWVYIEGVGFRRAEDIGSGVRGLSIDVYFDSESKANRFGRVYGYNVYIIGPTKPSTDKPM